MPYRNEHASRQKDPSKYVRFRRENDKFGSGRDVIWGITKDGKAEIQAIRFDKSKFTPDQVKSWLKSKDFKTNLEAAKAITKEDIQVELILRGYDVDKVFSEEIEKKLDSKLVSSSGYVPSQDAIIELHVPKSALEEIVPLLLYIKKIAGIGHSYDIMVDPDMKEYKKQFFIDGDGSTQIHKIIVDGKEI